MEDDEPIFTLAADGDFCLNRHRASKSQWIRAIDVVAVGPLMIWGGVVSGSRQPILGAVLAAMGVGTILLNGRNYLAVREASPFLDEP